MAAFEEIDNFDPDEYYNLDLTDPQSDFYLGIEKYKLFVAGFGAGKSFTMAICAVSDLINFPGADIGVYAPTYDLLGLVAMPYIAELLEYGEYKYRFDGTKKMFFVEGYGRIICRSMDNPITIVGYQVFRSHCDEMDIMKEEKANTAWNKIIARNRQIIYTLDVDGNKIPVLDEKGNQKRKQKVLQWEQEQNGVSVYTTPEGFRFAYNRWVRDKKENDGYGMYKASSYSNPHLQEDYIENLRNTYPSELVDAYINGEFVNMTAGRVYRKFDRKLNFTKEEIKQGDVLHVGVDFNIEHGAASIGVVRNNCFYTLDEIVDSFDTDDTIRILKERYPDHKILIYPDASGKKRSSSAKNSVDSKGEATATDLAKLKRAGFEVVVNLTNPLIKDRVACVQALILNGKGIRRWFVNPVKCPAHIRTLEQQVYENGLPDKSTGLDHIGDAFGYVITKLFPIEKPSAGFITHTTRRR